jgi:type IX secretion system PorP/SprF family membrane protein
VSRRKLVLAIFGMMLTGGAATAQQRPHYTQYILNNYIINPAVGGIENYTDVKLSHRHQWVGLDGAPVTTYASIHGPIGKKDFRTSATSFDVPGENPRGRNYWEQYTAAEPHHGIGMIMLNDKTGPLSRWSINATYSYHLGLTARTSLSAGFSAGISGVNLNASQLNFGKIAVDPAVFSQGQLKRIRPDLGAGLWLYSANYFVGLSAQQIIPTRISFGQDSVQFRKGRLVPHLFLSAGYKFFLNDDITAIPSMMVQYVSPTNPQVDINIKVQYQDRLWLGASVRQADSYAAMAGINVSNTFNIGYAYEITTSRLNTVSRGTHEIMVGFLLGNNFGDFCPRNVW